MKTQLLLVLISLISLAACDDRAAVRRALAQCQLSPRATDKDPGGIESFPDTGYLSLCMQAKGFVSDDNLMWGSTKCGNLQDSVSLSIPNCYRDDTVLAKWEAQIGK